MPSTHLSLRYHLVFSIIGRNPFKKYTTIFYSAPEWSMTSDICGSDIVRRPAGAVLVLRQPVACALSFLHKGQGIFFEEWRNCAPARF